MEVRRFFAQVDDMDGDTICLEGDEFIHLSKVLRYKEGYKAIVCLNDGFERYCTVQKILPQKCILSIDESKKVDSKSKSLTICAGLLKNNKLDFVIQKAVELGVDCVQPFVSRNTVEKKFSLERAQKIALEAAKQCGSAYLTRVCEPITYEELLFSVAQFDSALLACEFERRRTLASCDFSGRNFALIVGSEGGFTQQEVDAARQKGVGIVTLGKRILRAETASIVACALTLDAMGELAYGK